MGRPVCCKPVAPVLTHHPILLKVSFSSLETISPDLESSANAHHDLYLCAKQIKDLSNLA
jgi:hypothetical protein